MGTGCWLVRPMDVSTDIESVCEISREAFMRPGTAKGFRKYIEESTDSHVFVVWRMGHGVVGYCAVLMVVDELHIHDLAIRESWRRCGVGSILFESTIRSAAALGARQATLEVRASNLGARRFYERFGFRAAGKRKHYYSDPVDDALVLWMDSFPELETDPAVC